MFNGKMTLPPLLISFDGDVRWEEFDSVDFESVGLFLSCHLLIEHYLDAYLVSGSTSHFDWRGAGLTFGQKVSLLSGDGKFKEPYTIPASLKHFNSIRNKLSHNVNFKLTLEVLLPEIQFVNKVDKNKIFENQNVGIVLQLFTSVVCAFLAGAITKNLKAQDVSSGGSYESWSSQVASLSLRTKEDK